MSLVGQPERATQNRVIALFRDELSYRYLGENGPTYLESTMKQPRWLFRIKPDRFETWQGVGWARRYWVEETGGPTYEEAHASV